MYLAVVSIRIKKELKEKMLKYKDQVNWAEEIRRFIEKRIEELEAEENIHKIIKALERASWSLPEGYSARCVREDRDSH